MSRYIIRAVDGSDDDIASELQTLNLFTFGAGDQAISPEQGWWWIAFYEDEPVGFAGLMASTYFKHAGYFNRVGVLPAHRSHGLQRRFMARVEAQARKNGWRQIVSDTTNNPASANCFVRRNWRMFTPPSPWAFSNSLYWRKILS